ncbi:MAG: PDDEXK nuclease domain-containing protein [Verrucomicrobia bacterium]|nr:PDDEXK nuclease domain-containing protein [Verrucomicrobiota bacterium]
MSESFDFNQLVAICQTTHDMVLSRAVRTIDASLVVRNWLFGRYMVEFEQRGQNRADYGAQLIDKLSERLKLLGIKGTSSTRLKLYRSFYLQYQTIRPTLPDEFNILLTGSHLEKGPTLSDELANSDARPAGPTHFAIGWSHYVVLLTIGNPDERRFYEIETAANAWSVRELERQIAASLYERLALSRDKEEIRQLARHGQIVEKAADILKNPLVLEFLDLEEKPAYSESDFESAIIDKLEHFLLELGKGFLFESRQRRFTFDNDHFHVDLVFYNRLLRCYVLIDLKRDKLTHQDLGQMQMYVNYFDRFVKTQEENPSIGIVLCKRRNKSLVELTLPKDINIFAPQYQLYLPSKEELQAQLEAIQSIEQNQGNEPRAKGAKPAKD